MPYEAGHVADPGYLWIVHRGAGSASEYKMAHARLAGLLRLHHLGKLLVDVREVANEIPLADHFWMTSTLPDIFPKGCRVAIIVNPEIQTNAKFVEDVARNRGLDLCCFGSKEEALHWLLNS